MDGFQRLACVVFVNLHVTVFGKVKELSTVEERRKVRVREGRERERERERERGRQAGRQADTETDRQTDRQTETERNRDTERDGDLCVYNRCCIKT